MVMIKKLFHLFLLSFSLAVSGASKKEIQKTKDSDQMENERFYYDVCCSAPRLNPGEYVSVGFIGESGTLRPFGNNSVGGEMGGGMDGVARDWSARYRLPKAIEATWVSYTDRKVYTAASWLPYDTILSLFRNGGEPCIPAPSGVVNEDDRNRVIKAFDLCFLPGGKVMLYVKAGVKRILLDWSVMGVEVTDDEVLRHIYKKRGLKNIEEYFDIYYSDRYSDYESWRSYVSKHGTIAPLIERYLQRFNYTLDFEFENQETSIYSVESKFINGERYSRTPKYNEAFKMPSRLKEFLVKWDTKDSRYTCFMYFNEAEMLKVFDEAYGEDRSQKGELKIKVCKYNNLFDISLNVGDKSIKLEKTEIRVFQDPIEKPDGKGTLIYKNYEGNHKNLFADDEKYVGE